MAAGFHYGELLPVTGAGAYHTVLTSLIPGRPARALAKANRSGDGSEQG